MIVFDLACECGCTFEGWFQDRRHFENQRKSSYLECPQCGSSEIQKILSPIPFHSSSSAVNIPANNYNPDQVSAEDAEKALKILQKFVESNFEDVGTDLTREALKIHYGVIQPRNIRGVATESEEKKLKEEGINLLKIPLQIKSEKTN